MNRCRYVSYNRPETWEVSKVRNKIFQHFHCISLVRIILMYSHIEAPKKLFKELKKYSVTRSKY